MQAYRAAGNNKSFPNYLIKDKVIIVNNKTVAKIVQLGKTTNLTLTMLNIC